MLVWNILENAMSQGNGITGIYSIKEEKRPFLFCMIIALENSRECGEKHTKALDPHELPEPVCSPPSTLQSTAWPPYLEHTWLHSRIQKLPLET